MTARTSSPYSSFRLYVRLIIKSHCHAAAVRLDELTDKRARGALVFAPHRRRAAGLHDG